MNLSEWIYRILLKAYPKRYRERYEQPMAQLFRDQLRGAKTPAKRVRLWLRTTLDLLRTAPLRHWERSPTYDVAARRCIFFARYAAEGLEHAEITPEDLLAGLLREDKGIRRLLTAEARAQIQRELGSGPPRHKILRLNVPLSPGLKRILVAARQDIERTGEKQILPRHLIAAIMRDNRTPAAQILRRHGIGH